MKLQDVMRNMSVRRVIFVRLETYRATGSSLLVPLSERAIYIAAATGLGCGTIRCLFVRLTASSFQSRLQAVSPFSLSSSFIGFD